MRYAVSISDPEGQVLESGLRITVFIVGDKVDMACVCGPFIKYFLWIYCQQFRLYILLIRLTYRDYNRVCHECYNPFGDRLHACRSLEVDLLTNHWVGFRILPERGKRKNIIDLGL